MEDKEISEDSVKDAMMDPQAKKIEENLSKIKHKIVVISGKGGVGKTTVSVNLAISLASIGLRVGIIDVDITGPNVGKMMGIPQDTRPRVDPEKKIFFPVAGPLNVKVMSMAFLTESPDDPVIWRGPMKMSAVRQFLADAEWGELDYLVCDLPPGTSDETLDMLQLIPDENIIVVTTPQEVAMMDARKTINMAQIMKRKVLGIVENMSGYKCPKCGEYIDIFGKGGAEKASNDFKVALLGKIPFEAEVGQQGDKGLPFVLKYPESESAKAFNAIVKSIQNILEK